MGLSPANSGSQTLSGTAGGDLTGTYPNPTIAVAAVTVTQLALSGKTVRTAYPTLIDIVNSVAETDILGATGHPIPANNLGANGFVRVTLFGDYIHNDTTSRLPVFGVYFGGTQILAQAVSNTATATATARPWRLTVELANLNATNSQIGALQAIIGRGGDGTTPGEGDGLTVTNISGQNGLSNSLFTAAKDTTAAQTLRITATLSTASANKELRVYWAVVEAAFHS